MPEKTDIGIWRAQVERFRRECEHCPTVQQRDRLAEALQLAPLDGIAPAVEALIAHGAFETAALAVIGHDTPFMLSRSADGHCLATIAGHGVEVSAQGASPALALLGAWAGALLLRTAGTGAGHGPTIASPLPSLH